MGIKYRIFIKINEKSYKISKESIEIIKKDRIKFIIKIITKIMVSL
jgi:hypothetical protein